MDTSMPPPQGPPPSVNIPISDKYPARKYFQLLLAGWLFRDRDYTNYFCNIMFALHAVVGSEWCINGQAWCCGSRAAPRVLFFETTILKYLE